MLLDSICIYNKRYKTLKTRQSLALSKKQDFVTTNRLITQNTSKTIH